MIEVGKSYTLTMLELNDSLYGRVSMGVTVTGRDGNLLEVNGCEVINMASPFFHSLVDEEKQREFFNRANNF
jgi:hypothetical protein